MGVGIMRKSLILFFVFLLFLPVIAGCAKPPAAKVEEGRSNSIKAQEAGEYLKPQARSEVGREQEEQVEAQPAEPIQPVQPAEAAPDPSPDIPTVEIVSASSDFDFDLLEQVIAKDPTGNVVISPLSVRMALAMAYNGADGAAKEAMADVLDFEGMSLEDVNIMMYSLLSSLGQQGEDVQLEIANSFWGQEEENFYDDIVQSCRDCYGAELQRVDFRDPGVVQVINGWANEKTHGKIPVIVPEHELIKDNVFAWMNAVYLKAAWTFQFMEERTREEDFILPDGQRIKVPLMRQSAKLEYLENEDFQAVCLPYEGGRMGMYIFLPREGKDLSDLRSGLNRESWEGWIQTLERRQGTIYLPRFKLEYGEDLTGTLRAMGMEPAFKGNALPKVFASLDPVALMIVLHKVVIEVDEAGTEAAAVTYVGGGVISAPPAPSDPFAMRVDHPFFFAIRDNQTGAILFMGSIVDPS
jgi:serine protease inhibitor